MDENLDFARIQVFVQLFEQKTCTKNCTTVSVVIETTLLIPVFRQAVKGRLKHARKQES